MSNFTKLMQPVSVVLDDAVSDIWRLGSSQGRAVQRTPASHSPSEMPSRSSVGMAEARPLGASCTLVLLSPRAICLTFTGGHCFICKRCNCFLAYWEWGRLSAKEWGLLF